METSNNKHIIDINLNSPINNLSQSDNIILVNQDKKSIVEDFVCALKRKKNTNFSDIYFNNFLPEQTHLKGDSEVAISETSYPSLYQIVTEKKFTFVDGRESPEEKRKIQPMHNEHGLYPSFVDIIVAMNDKVRKRIGAQNYEHNGVYVSLDKITQKVVIQLP